MYNARAPFDRADNVAYIPADFNLEFFRCFAELPIRSPLVRSLPGRFPPAAWSDGIELEAGFHWLRHFAPSGQSPGGFLLAF
jgi:hypothetical protein